MPVVIHRITQLDLRVRPWRWAFAEQRRAEIEAHFALKQQERPQLWNGRVLLGRNPVFIGDRCSADYFEIDFASFLAWRDWGFPDKSVFNGFGMGALRCGDGAFVLGEMSDETANAGRVYFPSGTPDLNDVVDGTVDIARSVVREVREETGLTEANYRAAPCWHCVVVGSSIAMMRLLDVATPGESLKTIIEANLARQRSPELSGIRLIRSSRDFTAEMPKYVTAFIDFAIASGV